MGHGRALKIFVIINTVLCNIIVTLDNSACEPWCAWWCERLEKQCEAKHWKHQNVGTLAAGGEETICSGAGHRDSACQPSLIWCGWWWRAGVELETKVREVFTITEKAPSRAFSWLKVATTMFTFKNLSTRPSLVTFASATQFQFYLPWVHTCLALA